MIHIYSDEKILLHLIYSAFIQIRHDIVVGDIEQATRLCNLFHNVPLQIEKVGYQVALTNLMEKVKTDEQSNIWISRTIASI
jgi:hypothetical protein